MAGDAAFAPAWTAAAETLRALLVAYGCDAAALAAARNDIEAAFAAPPHDVAADQKQSDLAKAVSLVVAVQRVPLRKMRAIWPMLSALGRHAWALARHKEAAHRELARMCELVGADLDNQKFLVELTEYKELADWIDEQERQLHRDELSFRLGGHKNRAFNSFAGLLIIYHHRVTGAWPTITTDPKTSEFSGRFFRFVEAFFAAAMEFADRQGATDHSLWPTGTQARGAAVKRLLRKIRNVQR